MADEPFTTPGYRPPPRLPRPGEFLFECVRASDGAAIRCELMFHGESYGWETRFLERGELFYSHGGYATKTEAIAWATAERQAIEKGGD